jgi:P27 family predicted phage terminase small subunit
MSVKKPTNLKILEGNPGKRPLKRQEKNDKLDNIQCPIWLNVEAKREWKKILPYLKRLGVISNGDKAILAMYCQNYARWKQAEAELDNKELTVLGRSGFIMNPLIKISATYQQKMNFAIQKLGLNPSDRASLDILMNDDNEDDGIAKYLK